MKTAVQLRPIASRDLPRCDLVSGAPPVVITGGRGRVALFGPGEVVGYRIRYERRTRLFVFRTLASAEPRSTELPGVRPHVRLLVAVHSAGRAALAKRLFVYLARIGREPARLPDGFYLRVGVLLSGRLPRHKVLASLLSSTPLAAEPHP
jgi:hypothetical protein